MRLPVVPQISTKDGVSNKNARLTNCLKEVKKSGEKAVVRPGLVLSDTYAGLGNGLIEFDGRLLVVYDDTVTDVTEDSFPWPLDAGDWSSVTLYNYGDAVWYLGAMWFSTSGSNTGNTPGAGTSWSRSYEIPEWDSGTTYTTGSPVSYGGVTYYYWGSSGSNQSPASNPTLWRIVAPNLSVTMGTVTYTPATLDGFPSSQTASWTYYLGATPIGTGAGSTSSVLADNVATMTVTNWPRASTANQGSIIAYQAMPSTPPYWLFNGSTQWSGKVGWVNSSWDPGQSTGSWTVANP